MNKIIESNYEIKEEDSGYYLFVKEGVVLTIRRTNGFFTIISEGEVKIIMEAKLVGCGFNDKYELNLVRDNILTIYANYDKNLIFSSNGINLQ